MPGTKPLTSRTLPPPPPARPIQAPATQAAMGGAPALHPLLRAIRRSTAPEWRNSTPEKMTDQPPDDLPQPGPEPSAEPDSGLAAALRRATRDGRGRVVLRVEEAAPHRRKVARALLQEGALAAGGQVLDGPGGDLLLVGAEPGRAARLRELVERLVGPATTQILCLQRDASALLAYGGGGPAPVPRLPDEGPGLAGLDAFLDAMPLNAGVRRLQGWPVAGGTRPAFLRPAFLRIEPDRARLRLALGPLGQDEDLLDHATRRLATRLLGALADIGGARAWLGTPAPPRLHLPLAAGLPLDATANAIPPGLLTVTLPLSAAADPEALARRRAGLSAAGIGLEIEGVDAAALRLLDGAALAADLIRLRWSPALAEPWAGAALHSLGLSRIVVTDASAEAASRLGVALIEAEAP